MIHKLSISAETDRVEWREQLLKLIEPEDTIVLSLEGDISFTQTRQLITALNTVAWQRKAMVQYDGEETASNPPLPIRYSRPPSITPPKINPTKPASL